MENLEPNQGKKARPTLVGFSLTPLNGQNGYKVTLFVIKYSHTSNAPWTHTVLVFLDLDNLHSLKEMKNSPYYNASYSSYCKVQ